MSERTWEACVGCGHDIEKHFQNVIGKVRCLVTHHGVSSSGVTGIPYTTECDCVDYHSARAEKQKAEEQAEEDRWAKIGKQLAAEILHPLTEEGK